MITLARNKKKKSIKNSIRFAVSFVLILAGYNKAILNISLQNALGVHTPHTAERENEFGWKVKTSHDCCCDYFLWGLKSVKKVLPKVEEFCLKIWSWYWVVWTCVSVDIQICDWKVWKCSCGQFVRSCRFIRKLFFWPHLWKSGCSLSTFSSKMFGKNKKVKNQQK